MRLAVFGTGYAGLVTSTCLAHLGHTVTAVDKRDEVVERLVEGIPTIHEPDLAPLLAGNLAAGRLRFTTRPAEAMQEMEVVFLCVGTPPQHDGRMDLPQVDEVVRCIAPMLNGYTLIVEKSTVPARTASRIAETIRRLAPGREFDVASNPEFLREGTAVQDFLHPDRIVIGAGNRKLRRALSARRSAGLRGLRIRGGTERRCAGNPHGVGGVPAPRFRAAALADAHSGRHRRTESVRPRPDAGAGGHVLHARPRGRVRRAGPAGGAHVSPWPQDDPARRRPDIGKAHARLRWQPTVPLRDWLRKTIAWFATAVPARPVTA